MSCSTSIFSSDQGVGTYHTVPRVFAAENADSDFTRRRRAGGTTRGETSSSTLAYASPVGIRRKG